jgi:hypothetical protein
MFVARYENTMRNARPKIGPQDMEWKSVEQIRLEKRRAALAEMRAKAEAERIARERAELEARIEQAIREMERDREALRKCRVSTEFSRIMRRACKVFRITPGKLCSHRRSRDLAFARHFVMYWARRRTNLSFPRIADLIGGRDHTTCLHGAQKYPRRRAAMGRYLRPAKMKTEAVPEDGATEAGNLFAKGHGTIDIARMLGVTEAEALKRFTIARSKRLGLPYEVKA